MIKFKLGRLQLGNDNDGNGAGIITPPFLLSASSVRGGSPIGTVVGTLRPWNDAGSATYTITADPDNKFTIVGNELRLDGSVDFGTDPSHSVTVQQDIGGDLTSRTFVITVYEPFANNYSLLVNGVGVLINSESILMETK